jgi:hypothetical protein
MHRRPGFVIGASSKSQQLVSIFDMRKVEPSRRSSKRISRYPRRADRLDDRTVSLRRRHVGRGGGADRGIVPGQAYRDRVRPLYARLGWAFGEKVLLHRLLLAALAALSPAATPASFAMKIVPPGAR